MAVRGKRGRYHHGDLRAALIAAAIELIDETGVRDFSMAEVSRRVGVATSAPYAHFADRKQLLAAIAVQAYETFFSEVAAATQGRDPEARLAAIAGAYVRFAGRHRALFATVFIAGIDKREHPEVLAAEQPFDELLGETVAAIVGGDGEAGTQLASAVEAVAHGHAMLLLDGDWGAGPQATASAAARAQAAARALIMGRGALADPPPSDAGPDRRPLRRSGSRARRR